ncbi:cyclic nucleotide-binding protein [Legionella gratiana]|uniref:Cyclic nucleotide-binding protein n=1 Tax=Legionella gratiana TaxID=45066 RepID=A0A378JG53_9GAMM|nr:cyclic nucleotide-binding domain-containing protein [Legionella gratiana]KTD10664.1 cyclic nucleotide-binding protein [Legionella gratiana]STX43650.1 cyclic nucleotide-binding protein [Legionella gratiana]
MNAIDALKKSSIFFKLNERILWRIAALGNEKQFVTDDYLMKEGQIGDQCFILISGKVEIFRILGDDRKLVIAQLGPGEILGELAIIDELPRSANVIALEPTSTIAISAWDFKAQLQAYPEIALQLLPVLAQRLRKTQDKLFQMQNHE